MSKSVPILSKHIKTKSDLTCFFVHLQLKKIEYMRHLFILLFALIFASTQSFAHKKASWNIILDTDGAADDFRMLQLVLSSPDFNLNAVCTSDGVLSTDQAAAKIKGMLNEFYHEGVPVAAGKSLDKPFIHREFANSLLWPGKLSDDYSHNTSDLILESLKMHTRKNVIVVAGPMTNVADLLREHPEALNHIHRIVWYHQPENPGMNYLRDSASAKFVIQQFPAIEFVNVGKEKIFLDTEFLSYLQGINNQYSNSLFAFMSQKSLKNHAYLGQYPVWDECLPLYILFPQMFEFDGKSYQLNQSNITASILAVLHVNKPVQGVVWQKNAVGKAWLRDDIFNVSESIIQKYGYTEFQVVAMTSEFHGHLGIYSIVGAKMGLRAMQYFSVGLDELEVYSWAGSRPPLSCMNDGLQFSTGASLGYGTIHVVEDSLYLPKAIFDYNGRVIEMSLKAKYQKQFREDVKESIDNYGLLTDAYWDAIRRIGIEYWKDLNKLELFDIKEIKNFENN